MVFRGILIQFLILLFFCSLVFCSEQTPQRIISLGSTITEEVYLLGAQDNLVGVTAYCQRPADAQKKEKVGTIKEVNLEEVISLKPDLVLATSLTDPKAKEKLRALGINVVEFSYAKNFNELCNEFQKLARAVNKEREAERIISQARNDIDDIRKKAEGLSMPKVLIQIGAKPLFVATSDSFINDFIEFAGGINVAVSSRSGLYSREMVLRKNPDVIIIATMGLLGKEEMDVWKKYKVLNAAKFNRIYVVDAYGICSPTPVSFVESLKEISRILHPETEKNL